MGGMGAAAERQGCLGEDGGEAALASPHVLSGVLETQYGEHHGRAL